jgi:tetratricopeptide (TPR) repeat protein
MTDGSRIPGAAASNRRFDTIGGVCMLRVVLRLAVVLAVLLGSLGAAAGARAQADGGVAPLDPEEQIARARTAFERGRAAYDAGRFEEALEAFREAHALTGSPDLLYNIATVADRLRRDRDALDAYERYLAQRPDTDDRENVEARIRVLREALGESGAATGTAAAASTATAAGTGTASPRRRRAEARRPRDDGPGAAPWIFAGVGAAVAAAGGYLLASALGDVSDVQAAPIGSEWRDYEEANDRAPLFSTLGIALLCAGGAAVAVGIVWAIDGGGGGDDEAAVDVAIGPVGVRVRGTF